MVAEDENTAVVRKDSPLEKSFGLLNNSVSDGFGIMTGVCKGCEMLIQRVR